MNVARDLAVGFWRVMAEEQVGDGDAATGGVMGQHVYVCVLPGDQFWVNGRGKG